MFKIYEYILQNVYCLSEKYAKKLKGNEVSGHNIATNELFTNEVENYKTAVRTTCTS